MKGKLKQTKGITLIALIITIIILLILAVVSIRLVVNNGILGKSEKAVKAYSESETEEKVKLAYSDYQMGKLTDSSYTFEQALANAGLTATVTGSDLDGYIVTTTLSDGTEKKFNVTSTGVSKLKTTVEEFGLQIGDYIAYDATKDANGKTITGEKATYTSYSASNASSDKNEGRSSGYSSNQVFNLSSYTGGWRVLGVKNGQLQLISADIIGPDSGGYTDSTNGNKYYLKGRKGYTDGPGELNAISAMYGQGKGAESARSVTVKDINDITGYKPEETGDGKPYRSGTIEEYNNKVTYYWDGTEYPYYEYGEGENQKTGNLQTRHSPSFKWYDGTNWQSSAKSTTAKTNAREKITDLTSNYYWYYPTTLTTSDGTNIKGIAKTSNEWKLLFENTGNGKYYWLASPYVGCSSLHALFGLRGVNNEGVSNGSYGLFRSDEYSFDCRSSVRPVVSLKSDIQIEKTETNDGSALAKACIIK